MLKNILIVYELLFFVFFPFLAWSQLSQSSSNQNSLNATQSADSFGISGDSNNKKNTEEAHDFIAVPPTGPGVMSSLYYNIHVLGEVTRPGNYRILPSDRITNALKYAGGITSAGSQRKIELRRGDKSQLLDIYAYKYNGDLFQNPYLMENDVIFVSLKKAEFQIEGPVNRPGNYEMVKKMSLQQGIDLAGGIASGLSTKEPIRVIRFDENEKKQVIEVELSQDAWRKFRVQRGDIIIIPHLLLSKKKFDYNVNRIPGDNIFYPTINDKVYVVGAVTTPGPYNFQPTFKVQDYVSQAGPLKDASLGKLKIITSDGTKKGVSKKASINAGETIIVPPRSLTAMNFVTWFGALTSMALTTLIFVDRFAPEAFR